MAWSLAAQRKEWVVQQHQEQASWAVRAVTLMSEGSLGYADWVLSTAALPEAPVRSH